MSIAKMGTGASAAAYPVYCEEEVMSPKSHGTCAKPVMKKLRWNCDYSTADRICCFNRHYAEHSGYWETTSFLREVSRNQKSVIIESIYVLGKQGRRNYIL